jgi:hypothetical protein
MTASWRRPIGGAAVVAALAAAAATARPPATVAPGAAAEPVALLTARGEVVTCVAVDTPCGAAGVAASSYSWLQEGWRLELPAGAAAEVLLLDGRRWELRGPVAAIVHAAGVAPLVVPGAGDVAGRVQAHPAPASVDVLALAPADRAADALGAIRVRNGGIGGLYPAGGATALADRVTLSFAPAPGATRHAVSVLDAVGREVFAAELDDGRHAVVVPPGLLRRGERFLWRVSTLGRPGGVLRGEAEVLALDALPEQRRARLADGLGRDAAGLLALAEVDRRLGLLAEARGWARRAAGLAPADEELQRAVAAFERRLGPGVPGGP